VIGRRVLCEGFLKTMITTRLGNIYLAAVQGNRSLLLGESYLRQMDVEVDKSVLVL
jgi:hypothetical protein